MQLWEQMEDQGQSFRNSRYLEKSGSTRRLLAVEISAVAAEIFPRTASE